MNVLHSGMEISNQFYSKRIFYARKLPAEDLNLEPSGSRFVSSRRTILG